MKHLLSTALLCGMAVLSSNAQNIVVVDKDNISHRYHADYVQDISFVKDGGEAQVTELTFESLSVQTWTLSNLTLHFGTGNDETKVDLDIYQPRGYWLGAGEFTVAGTYAQYTIDPGYSTILVDGTSLALTGGNMSISYSGDVYSITMDLLTADGQEIKGTYNGTVDKFGPILTTDLTAAAYQEINDPAPNGFYYKFNDANWDVTMRLDFFCNETQLANGVYTISDSKASGTVSIADSYVDLAAPYSESSLRFTEGTVTVSGEGADRTINVKGTLSIGLEVDFTYTGELAERPVAEPAADYVMNANAVNASAIWGMTNPYLTFTCTTDATTKVVMDIHQPGTSYLLPGTYEVLKVNGGTPTTDYYITGVGSTFKQGNLTSNFNGGTVNVTLSGKEYTFEGLIELQNGKTLQFTYTGELGNCGPSEPVGPAYDYTIVATTVEDEIYSSGSNFALNMVDANNPNQSLMLDLYQTAKYYLQPGSYPVDSTEAAGTIGNNPSYSFFASDGVSTGFKSGDVLITLDGEIYTIDADIRLTNDKTVKATYTGKIANGPVVNFDLKAVTYVDVNDPAANGFYYRFNDQYWGTETRIDFFAEGTTTLPDGTYTFADSGANGTAQSSVSLYRPNAPISANTQFKSGTVTVATVGANRVITIDGILAQDDLHMTATYTGELPERPYTGSDDSEINFQATSCVAMAFGTRNYFMQFVNADASTTLALDLYHANNWYLQPGTYTIGGTDDGQISTDIGYSYFTDGTKVGFQSGEVVFALDGQIYTMTADIVLADGKKLHATYTGTLSCGPNTQEYTLTGATYVNVNDPAANGFYYRFSDSNYKIEARIDFFAEGTTTLPDGTYTFGTGTANGTAQSLVDLYSPTTLSSAVFKSGTVTVATDGDNRIVTIEGVIGDDNVPVKAVYIGTLPERPSTEGPKTYNYTFEATTGSARNFGWGDWYVTLSGSGDEKIIMSMAPVQGSSLTPETYIIGDDTVTYFVSGLSANYYTPSGEQIAMSSGKVVVTKDGDTYTIVVDAVLENDETLYATYTGTL